MNRRSIYRFFLTPLACIYMLAACSEESSDCVAELGKCGPEDGLSSEDNPADAFMLDGDSGPFDSRPEKAGSTLHAPSYSCQVA